MMHTPSAPPPVVAASLCALCAGPLWKLYIVDRPATVCSGFRRLSSFVTGAYILRRTTVVPRAERVVV